MQKRKKVKRIEKFVSRFPFSGNNGNALGLHDQMKLQMLARKRGRKRKRRKGNSQLLLLFQCIFKLVYGVIISYIRNTDTNILVYDIVLSST